MLDQTRERTIDYVIFETRDQGERTFDGFADDG